jgi:pimeloyl-ACP methyl ester carboxylesterase
MSIHPYTICISPFVIEDLRERLGRARWPDEITGSGWEYGTNMAYLKDLCTHWGHGFDWKEEEEKLNQFSHFQCTIDDLDLHFIHEKGKGSNPIPLLLIHGYPDSFVRFLKLIPLLTAEGPDGISFDLIIPSIPGFGFSQRPEKPGMNTQKVASLFSGLMSELGYEKFITHGGDWGSSISEELAIQFPNRLLGMHLMDVPFHYLFSLKPDELTPKEQEYLQAGRKWQVAEGAYALLQSTKPQTLAYGVNDSPIGLAGWMIEKFYSWSDCNGDLETVYTRDELLTNLTIYWVTQTAGSAFRIYYERMHQPQRRDEGKKIKVPAAFCISAKDLVPAPREFAERIFNVQQWTQLPSGGHFVAMEHPQDLAADIVRFAEKVVGQKVIPVD